MFLEAIAIASIAFNNLSPSDHVPLDDFQTVESVDPTLQPTVLSVQNQIIDYCASTGEQGAGIMLARQSGVKLTDLLALMNEHAPDEGIARHLTHQMSMKAYAGPRYSTESVQESAIEDFQLSSEFECFKYINEVGVFKALGVDE
jgi:hypothetical protein